MISQTMMSDDSTINEAGPFIDERFGLPCISLLCAGGHAAVARQGAQVVSWRDSHGRERLYLSPQTGGALNNAPTDVAVQPIRGGIPVCFPQFSDRGSLPKHGFARIRFWQLEHAAPVDVASATAETAFASFAWHDDDRTRLLWPGSFHAELSVTLETDRLRVMLAITNNGDTPWSFTGALHTYLAVNDIKKTALFGLQNTRYQDATAGNIESTQTEEKLNIAGELDRVYLSPPKSLQLFESGRPSLHIEQSGFEDTVVWNPGPDNARRLTDFPDNGWLQMLCVEAACVAVPVVVQPGATWIGSQILSVAQ